MPFCTSCGNYFDGRGSRCAIHNPHYFTKTYNFDSSNAFPDIKYRTGYSQRDKPYKAKEVEDYTGLYDTDYANNDVYVNGVNAGGMDIIPAQNSYQQLSQTTAQTFRLLNREHHISSLSISSHPNGTRSLSITPNRDREKCPTCKKWFSDRTKLNMHKVELPSGCEEHSLCFGFEEEHYHGTSWRHDRCFVKRCPSIYRREGGWKTGVVDDHVRSWHLGTSVREM